MNGVQGGVHPSAVIGRNVLVGEGTRIGPGAVVYDNVEIGPRSVIGANVVLGEPLADFYRDPANYFNPRLVIGADAVVRSGSVLYAGSTMGRNFVTGHGVTIREGTRVGDDSRIGTQSDIQGECTIGRHVRIHSGVITSQGVVIEDFVWILPKCILSDCPHPPSDEVLPVRVGRFAVIAAGAVILPGVVVGADSLVGAAALVKYDVAEGSIVVGQPARQVGMARDIVSKSGRTMYPWRTHFERGMPWAGVGYEAWEHARRSGEAHDS